MCEAPCTKKLTNKHLYECKTLNENEQNINFRKLFNGTIENKNKVLSVLDEKYEKWKKINEILISKNKIKINSDKKKKKKYL